MQCSICQRADLAEHVNELLFRSFTIEKIADQTGVSRSAVARHRHGTAPAHRYPFLEFRAKKLRQKSAAPGRVIVQWENGSLEHYGEAVEEKSLRPDDVIFLVCRAAPVPNNFVWDTQIELAYTENAARHAAKLAEETADAEVTADAGNSPHL
jgi:hypothetical protein